MNEVLIGLLSRAYNLDSERIAELLFKKDAEGQATDEINEGALQQILDLDVQRTASLKEDAKKRFDDGHKKGKLETARQWEKTLKERFGVDGEGDLILESLAEKVNKPTKTDLTDDAIKRHKLYQELERAAQEREAAALKAGEEKLRDFQLEQSKKERLSGVDSFAKDYLLQKLKPVLPTSQIVADKRIKDFLQDLRQFDWDENQNPLKDGESYKNAHGNLVSREQVIEEIAAMNFEFQVQDPKGNGGNQNQPGQSKPYTPGVRFTSKADFEAKYFAEQDPAARSQMAKDFQSAPPAG